MKKVEVRRWAWEGESGLRELCLHLRKSASLSKEKADDLLTHESQHVDAAKRRGYTLQRTTYEEKIYEKARGKREVLFEATVDFGCIHIDDISYICLAPVDPSFSDYLLGILFYDLTGRWGKKA